MTVPSAAQQALQTIDQFISAVGSQVKAAEEAHTEPGSIGGETKHPVKNVDDRTEVAQEGARSAENTKDVKEDQGSASVDSTPEAKAASIFEIANRFASGGQHKKAEGGAAQTPGSAADDQLQIGTEKKPTGDDPSNETSSAKGGKEDPGSKHPARTDNDSLDGHKYSSDDSLEKLASLMQECGNDLCAQLAWQAQQGGNPKTAAAAQQLAGGHAPKPPAAKEAGDLDPELLYMAGSELAGLITGTMDKQSADAMVKRAMEEIIKQASQDADRVITYLDNYFEAVRIKSAEGEPMPPHAGAGGPPMTPPDGGGGGGPEDEAAMMAALGGGDGGDGGGGGGGGSGGPPGPGGEGHDQEVAQLLQVLEQMGVTPEEVMQEMQQQEGGGEGGPPGGALGGAPGGGGPPMPGGGGMEPKAGSDRSKQSQEKHAGMQQYLRELIQRSRTRNAA